jgi:hypothetical protein
VPASAPCWFPDGSDRILFAGCDGRLHGLALPEAGTAGGAATSLEPRPVRWKTRPPGKGPTFLQEPCWPARELLGGRLLVALRYQRPSARIFGRLQVWWLELNPEGTAIAAAGRLIVPANGGGDGTPREERLPSVGRSADGVPMLAYVVMHEGHSPGELWIAPIGFAHGRRGDVPRVRAEDARRLSTTCAAAPPAFSADGRFLYAAVRSGPNGMVHVERFPLTGAGSPDDRTPPVPLHSAHAAAPSRPASPPA